MSANSEIWQVMIQGEVYEADMESLRQWVAEGRVLPTDKVRKGNFSWIQADRAPAMRRIFLDGDRAQPFPLLEDTAGQDQPDFSTPQSYTDVNEFADDTASSSNTWTAMPAAGVAACHNHPELPPQHVCRACGATFCQECPKLVNKITLCPLCGDLCQPYQKLQEKVIRQSYQRSGFGLQDFGFALRYPLKSIFTLIAAAMMYGFLLLAGFKGQMVAYMILFGCVSLVINRVSSGRMDRNFMPDFSAFSWWDDVLMPGLLGIGITIVTMGPTIVLVLALWFGLVGGASSGPMSPDTMQSEPEVSQSQLTPEDFDELVKGEDAEKSAEIAKKIGQLHPANQISTEMEKTKDGAGAGADSSVAFAKQLLYYAVPIILLFLLTLAWAVFYYPMALAVAGYTEDFWSVVNPLVGLDTIRRMGFVYVKAFLMYLCLEVFGVVLSIIIYIVTAPFDLPIFGNLPARFLDGMVTFYINLVLACLLGLALYKCADKLDIPTD